jgi:hypothetical protein
MSRSYTSLPPKTLMACSGTDLLYNLITYYEVHLILNNLSCSLYGPIGKQCNHETDASFKLECTSRFDRDGENTSRK